MGALHIWQLLASATQHMALPCDVSAAPSQYVMGSAAQQTLRYCQVDHRRSDSASSQSEVFKLLDSGDLEAAAPQQNGNSTGFGKLQQRLPVDQHVVGDTASHISAVRSAEDDVADGMPAAAMPASAEVIAGPWQQVRPDTACLQLHFAVAGDALKV